MKPLTKLALVLMLVASLAVVAFPAAAQGDGTATRTWTEDQINASYRVTNPWRRAITNVSVDLQPGRAVITATHTRRGHSPVQTVTTLVPRIEDGRVYWSVESILVDGQPASADLVAQVNAAIASSWRNYIRSKLGTGHVSAITITDSDLAVTYSRAAS